MVGSFANKDTTALKEGKYTFSLNQKKPKYFKLKLFDQKPPGAIHFTPASSPYTVLISYSARPTLKSHEISITVDQLEIFRIKTIFEQGNAIFKHDYVYLTILSETDIKSAIITCTFRKSTNKKKPEEIYSIEDFKFNPKQKTQ